MAAMLTTDFLGTKTTSLLRTITVAFVTYFPMSLDCYGYGKAPDMPRLRMFLAVFEMKVMFL
jgi:hypothetical protein